MTHAEVIAQLAQLERRQRERVRVVWRLCEPSPDGPIEVERVVHTFTPRRRTKEKQS
jgi:hypothetical protein